MSVKSPPLKLILAKSAVNLYMKRNQKMSLMRMRRWVSNLMKKSILRIMLE